MKILVIGASGLLARPVIEKLDQHGFQLRLFSRTVNTSMFDKDFDIIRGDLFNPDNLNKALDGCDAIHITISNLDEKEAVKIIVETAKKKNIKLISMVSGCTVSEENRWFKFVDNKFQAEQIIINSGISYLIFRPTWFFESLELMIRNGKATVLGNQPHPYHWIAADEFAQLIATAFSKKETYDKIFYVYGPKTYLIKDLMERYCEVFYPEIKKVSVVPIPVLKLIAILTGNKELKNATALFSYFQKVSEPEITSQTDELVGKTELDFEKWMELKKSR